MYIFIIITSCIVNEYRKTANQYQPIIADLSPNAQMIAGFLEQKMGNNFGFAAFTSYGSFWIGLGIIWILNHSEIYVSSHIDVGYYLIGWTLLTFIFWVGSLFIHSAMAFTFTTLLIGFIL